MVIAPPDPLLFESLSALRIIFPEVVVILPDEVIIISLSASKVALPPV